MQTSLSAAGEIKCINTHPGDPFLSKDGAIFGDGSVLHPSHKPLARAGYAIAQIHHDGSVHKAIFASLPDSMEQTAVNAEYAAFALAAYVAELGSVYVGDCKAVLDSFNGGLTKALLASGSHACAWKALDQKMVPGCG